MNKAGNRWKSIHYAISEFRPRNNIIDSAIKMKGDKTMILASEKRILVVDDELDIRNVLSDCLEEAGFVVEIATDDLDALKKIEANTPDLIIFDLAMLKMSGVKLKRKLRKNENWRNIPIILTMNEFYAIKAQIIPEPILAKPIIPSKLLKLVSKVLSFDDEKDIVYRSYIMNMVKFCATEKLDKIRNILT